MLTSYDKAMPIEQVWEIKLLLLTSIHNYKLFLVESHFLEGINTTHTLECYTSKGYYWVPTSCLTSRLHVTMETLKAF